MADELATITGTIYRNTADDADRVPWAGALVRAIPVLLDETAAVTDSRTTRSALTDSAGLVTLHLWPGAWQIYLPDGEVIDGDGNGVVVEAGESYTLLSLRGYVAPPGVTVTTVELPALEAGVLVSNGSALSWGAAGGVVDANATTKGVLKLAGDLGGTADLPTVPGLADKANVTDLGTAAALDVPATGDAATGEVVKGDDTRLFDARTPAAHTHTLAAITDAGDAAGLDVGTTAGTVAAGDHTHAELHTHANMVALAAVSGTNTGDEPAASTTVAGIVELATTTEVTTGTDTTRAVTPAGVKAALDAKTVSDSSTYETISNAAATYARPGAFSALKAALNAGRSATVLTVGDSTGNGTNEWVYLLAENLATSYPGHTVRHRLWNLATNSWDAPTVIQTGTGGGDRACVFDGTTNAYVGTADSATVSITGDLDVRVRVAADSWAAGVGVIAAQFGDAPNRAWRMYLGSTQFRFDWTTDGSTLQSAVLGVLTGLVTDGEPIWLRTTLDVDNGAGGHDIAMYYSMDGAAWTQIGTTTTRAGTTSIADVDALVTLGSRVNGSSEKLPGKIYEAHILDGINGPLVMPPLPELLTDGPAGTYEAVMTGAPILDIWNGHGPGYSLTNMIDAARLDKLVPPLGQSVTVLSCSHNDTNRIDPAYWADWDTLVARVRAMTPATGLVLTAQNPRYSPAGYITKHAQRVTTMRGYAASKGADLADAYTAFGTDTSLVLADGIHPTTAGGTVWAGVVRDMFDAAP